VPPTYLEQKRKEAQKHYLEDQAYLQAHKEEYERLIEQNQQAMAKDAPSNLWDAIRVMNGMKPSSEEKQDSPPS
jgi:import inner membrane translocase subunit TIM50